MTAIHGEYTQEEVNDALTFLHNVVLIMLQLRGNAVADALSTPEFTTRVVEGAAHFGEMTRLVSEFADFYTTPPGKKKPKLTIVRDHDQ